MTLLYYILGTLLIAGLALHFYERRTKRVLLKHDMDQMPNDSTEASREVERAIGQTETAIRRHPPLD